MSTKMQAAADAVDAFLDLAAGEPWLSGPDAGVDYTLYEPQPAEPLVRCAFCGNLTPESFMQLRKAGARARHCLDCPPVPVWLDTPSSFDPDHPFDLD